MKPLPEMQGLPGRITPGISKRDLKPIRKPFLCRIGLHKRQYCGAPFVLMGIVGRIETWVCTRCGYKHDEGTFIPNV